MNTETKTPKTRKARGERKRLDPITLGEDVSLEDADSAFNAIPLRTPLAKQLYSMEIGIPKVINGDLARVKTAVRGFEQRHGAKFRVGKHPTTGKVIAQRLAPEPVASEPAASDSEPVE